MRETERIIPAFMRERKPLDLTVRGLGDTAVVLLSGGQDSCTCLAWAQRAFGTVIAITADYGQRHRNELAHARWWAATRKVEHHIVDLISYGAIVPSALTSPIPIKTDGGLNNLPTTFTPARNLMLLTIAGAFAVSHGFKNLVGGMCQTDFAGYPDCRRIFINAFEVAFLAATDVTIEVHTPLMYKTKADTWAMAEELDVLKDIIGHTMTCYEGIVTPHDWGMGCGLCPACILRAQGYAEWRYARGLPVTEAGAASAS